MVLGQLWGSLVSLSLPEHQAGFLALVGSSSHTSVQRLQPTLGPPRNSPWPVSVWAAGPMWGSLGQQLVSHPC